MKMRRTRRLLTGLLASIALVTLGLLFSPGQQKVSAACAALPTDRGTVTQSVSLSAGTYTIWSRIRTDTPANNSYYMNIDNGGTNLLCNATMGGTTLTANTWTWVKHATTVTVTSGTAGTYTITMAGKDDNVEVDRVILTGDNTCTPDNNAVQISGVNYYGENCAPTDTTAPIVTVTAPLDNATLSGTTTNVTGSISDASTIASTSVYLDGSSTAAASAASPGTGAYSIPLSLSGLSVGAHQLVVKSTDADGNVGSSSIVNFTIPDTTPPVISAIASGSLTQTTATITWTTDEAADSQVDYGTTTSYGSSTTLNTSKVTSHSVNLSGLTASTTYHYRVKSKDAAGNLTTSTDRNFTTTAVVADTTKPTVSLTAPTNGATVSGSTSLTATASDASGIAGVQFQVNGANLGSEDTVSPYSVSWNTTGVANGSYSLTAIARDTAGNVQTSTVITVTVSNPAFLAEDINLSGKVDIADFSILASNYNKTTAQLSNPRADIDGSGKVDIVDFSRLASHYGQ